MGPEPHLQPREETCHSELPRRSFIDNYLDLTPGALNLIRLLSSRKLWHRTMTSCSPSVKGPSNGPVNHLTGNPSWKGCLFWILEDSVNLLKGPLAIVRCHPRDVPPLSVMHEAYPLHGVCIWPDLLQQSSQGREPREARTRLHPPPLLHAPEVYSLCIGCCCTQRRSLLVIASLEFLCWK